MFDGRGRWYRWDKKSTTDEYLDLDMTNFRKWADLENVCTGSLRWTFRSHESSITYIVQPSQGVRLVYQSKGLDYDYLVRVVTTAPNYGGKRYWWLCPSCSRRVRILYGGSHFLCRKCKNLTYESCQQNRDYTYRIQQRQRAIMKRLGKTGTVGLGNPFPDKPPYMHWKTYWKLFAEYRRLERLFSVAFVAGMESFGIGAPPVDIQALWNDHKSNYDGNDWIDEFVHQMSWEDEEPEPVEPERLTLGEVAKLADVPYAFAKEAQHQGLIQPDAGRGERKKRYRPKLASWLSKLYRLYEVEGLNWNEIQDWVERRWQPGHEHERRWPAGVSAD